MKTKIVWLLSGALLLAACAVTKTPEDLELDRERHLEAVAAFRNGDFVLEAYQLQNRRGDVAEVTALANFISMNKGKVTVQTSFNNGRLGSNGLGGITLEGDASDVKMSTDKNGNTNLEMDVSGNFLSARVEIVLYAGSTRAVAIVYPTFSGNRLVLNGDIVPFAQSLIFKGQTPI